MFELRFSKELNTPNSIFTYLKSKEFNGRVEKILQTSAKYEEPLLGRTMSRRMAHEIY